MSWITVIWSLSAGICLTMAMMHLLIWLYDNKTTVSLAFFLWAFSVACWFLFEMALMYSTTPQEYGELFRWMHVPMWSTTLGYFWFVRKYLKTGRPWLFWVICGLASLKLAINFIVDPNVTFSVISGLKKISFLGEIIVVPVAEISSWERYGYAAVLLNIIFVVDAVIQAWRQNRHRYAQIIGWTFVTQTLLTIILAGMTIFGGKQNAPVVLSFPSMVIILILAYALSKDLLQAQKISYELRKNKQRMILATKAVNLGIWEWDVVRNEFWTTEAGSMRVGVGEHEKFNVERFLVSVHPDDREAVRQEIRRLLDGDTEMRMEYRIVRPNSEIRWISAEGQVEFDLNGKPRLVRGISMDITERKQAKTKIEAARQRAKNLASRLTLAGEKERQRIASELHDNTGQALALCRLQLAALISSTADEDIKNQLAEISKALLKIAQDTRQMIFELSSATLTENGLASAIAEWADEKLKINDTMEFELIDRLGNAVISNELTTILFRNVRELLTNIVKHARADKAEVLLELKDNEIEITVKDNGTGFDPDSLLKSINSQKCFGLRSIKERMTDIGGRLEIHSAPFQGCTMILWSPITGTILEASS